MAFDRSKLGNLAAEQMQALEEKYGDDEENGSGVSWSRPRASHDAINARSPYRVMSHAVITP